MARYFTDFSANTAAATPSDWTARFQTANASWLVTTNAGFGGAKKGLVSAPTADGIHVLSWNTIDADAARTDVEILYRWKSNLSNTTDARCIARGSGSLSSENFYSFGVSNNTIKTGKALAGTTSNIGTTPAKTITGGTWYWTRAKVSGNNLYVKTWADGAGEPVYDIDTRASGGDFTTAGLVGLYHFVSVGDTTFDQFGVGTGGDTAPAFPVASGSAAGTITWAGASTGARASAGAAAGAVAWAGSATGSHPSKGAASGTIAWAGAAAGARTSKGGASGAVGWVGAAAGARPSTGSAAGAVTWAGAAAGAEPTHGAATGAIAWSGSATGEAPADASAEGSATGAVAWSGSATGKRTSQGSAAGTLAFAGAAAGSYQPKASATGAVAWVGTAAGELVAQGAAAGSITWAGVATGQDPNTPRDLHVVAVIEATRYRAATEHPRFAAAVAASRFNAAIEEDP